MSDEKLFTLVLPFYRQEQMLRKQFASWCEWKRETKERFNFIIVDDASPEPAEPIYVEFRVHSETMPRGELYRIDKDIPWNRSMARNLGTKMAATDWVIHVDTDHVIEYDSAEALVKKFEHATPTNQWYRFERRRIGAADETRKKDAVADDASWVKIHPHIDSYLCTKTAYKRAGGYNELFGGVLGGGSPFLKEMEKVNGAPAVLPIELHVHTRHSIPDSSERTLPRDPAAFKKRKQEIMASRGTLKYSEKEWLRLPWHRVF